MSMTIIFFMFFFLSETEMEMEMKRWENNIFLECQVVSNRIGTFPGVGRKGKFFFSGSMKRNVRQHIIRMLVECAC